MKKYRYVIEYVDGAYAVPWLTKGEYKRISQSMIYCDRDIVRIEESIGHY